jgi:hypothetical protein
MSVCRLRAESSLQTDVTTYSVPFALQRELSKKGIEEIKALYVKWHDSTEGKEEARHNYRIFIDNAHLMYNAHPKHFDVSFDV